MPREDDPESADLAREREVEWQQIIDNFGDRAVLEPDEEQPFAVVQPRFERDPEEIEIEVRDQVHPSDAFVPPTPPPLPRPPADRLMAWIGVFGVPAVVLVCVVAGISVPSWVGFLMAAGFVGGFGYLVVKMSDEPRDPWDDGAVL
ncbi:hypothetical protein F0U44_15105 [Nocardioides humilatus]|uniref:Uncharacterized protein n=1 Tax=Nocardioides humilatus TaxID=2607660 RepID=A0A5B1LB45_9ACTN|nr:hypothetical protein [Nocardioides humilatus]KAA1417961.1 hypothetical protein F0U44_15105 [Nocardioides humilatus]